MSSAPAGSEPVDQDDWEAHWGDYASTAEDNPAQAYRRARAFALLESTGPVRRLLDIGAGQGDLLHFAAERFPTAELAGLELSRTGVEACLAKVPTARVTQRNLLLDEPIDAHLAGWGTHAVCSEVLEHVDDPSLLLRNARSYLATGCELVVTVPGGPRSAFDRHIGHRRHFSRRRLSEVLHAGGFEPLVVQAAGFPAFNLYKLAVMARGTRLIEDVRVGDAQGSNNGARLATLAMRGFDPLFRVAALPSSPFGWQLVAHARKR